MKYQVKKSIKVDADADKVWELIEDFGRWRNWSPWSIVEPGHKSEVEGEKGKKGHKMTWEGEFIGTGEQVVTAASDEAIDYDLRFIKPWKSQSTSRFEVKKSGEGSEVTWIMNSSMPWFLFFMIPKMKAWVGMDFDRGLKMLKAMAEDGKVEATTTNEGIRDFDGFKYVGIKKTLTMADISTGMQDAFDQLVELLKKEGKKAKHWVTLYPKMNIKTGEMTCIAAMSTEDLDGVELGDQFETGEIPSGKALEIKHKGSFDFIGNAWSMGMMYLQAKKIKQKGVPFEYYWNNPRQVEEKDLESSVFFMVKE